MQDAHQGDGHALDAAFYGWDNVFIFDYFTPGIFPGMCGNCPIITSWASIRLQLSFIDLQGTDLQRNVSIGKQASAQWTLEPVLSET